MPHPFRLGAFVVCLGIIASPARATDGSAKKASAVTLRVDATEAPRHIFHARLLFPVVPGPMSLSYPKWIPGEHGPTGPLINVAGLKLTAAGHALSWQRDRVDMYAVRFTVPPNVRTLEATFDFLSPSNAAGFSSGASATPNLCLLSWNQVLLYPSGASSDSITYAASLRLPAGWKFGTALPVKSGSGSQIEFTPVSLTTLVDSPVIAGMNYRRIDLSPGMKPSHAIDIACDGKSGLEMSPADVAAYRRLVSEAFALFGARHYRDYHFLVSLSDHVAHFGLEHHESSDDRLAERALIDPDRRAASSYLLSHEFVHSWNGKYRRPYDLATPDFQQPMETDLLWVYEGLTQYLGWVLATRSGVATLERSKENLAIQAAYLDIRPGRTWRPLVDTAVEAQLLYDAPKEWASWRRGVDFYNEGLLIWLEADVTIRKLSGGSRSLDDFCHRFHGGANGPPRVALYTFDDVVKTLNDVAGYDWRSFLDTRINAVSPRAPMGGIEGSGWRIVYTDSLPSLLKSSEEVDKSEDLLFSLGLRVGRDDSVIEDVIPGGPAAKAGMSPGMKLVAVNGRRWTRELLHEAIRATRGGASMELLVDNGEFYRTFHVDYRGGERYPRLERIPGKPDLLGPILGPKATSAAQMQPTP